MTQQKYMQLYLSFEMKCERYKWQVQLVLPLPLVTVRKAT